MQFYINLLFFQISPSVFEQCIYPYYVFFVSVIDKNIFISYFLVKVLVTDPDKLEGIRARELDITKERIQKILATGVNVVLVTGGIDDLCLKYFVENGAMAVRRVKKQDLKRIAKATGAAYLTSLTNMDGRIHYFY